VAADAAGKRLGEYPDRAEAVRAIVAAAKGPTIN